MCRGIIRLGYLIILLHVFLSNTVQSHVDVDSARACALTHCNRTEYCVNRKFWCKNPPCPRMLYCAKTRRESLKGPMTCESVRCSKGYVCHIRVRRCRWDQRCEHQVARCVSELEYYHGPASCIDSRCSSGYQCILKESMCAYPPCKLLKSCAKRKDVQIWHSRCRTLGCLSEYECFLRRPSGNCSSTNSCNHTPDCTVTNAKQPSLDSLCSGWVCPRHQECSALTPKPSCNLDDGTETCKVNRTCRRPLASVERTSSRASARLIPRAPTTTSTQDSEPQKQNPETSQIPTQYDYKESHHHPGHSTTPTAPATESMRGVTPSKIECDATKSTVNHDRNAQFEKWNLLSDSIYRTPVYFRSTVNRKSVKAGESPREEQPIDRSITQWPDELRLKTGDDAISASIKHAEQNKEYEQFVEWLRTVETTLGPLRFESWLDEIRKFTTQIPAFQKWLPASPFTEHDVRNENDTEQDILKELSDPKQKPQPYTEQGNETTEDPVNGYKVLDYSTSPTSPSPKDNESKTSDEPTKASHHSGQKLEKLWGWQYDKPGTIQNVQPEEELGNQQKLKELEEWPANSADSQPSKGCEIKTKSTTIPTSNSPKQPHPDTLPIDVAQFGREMDLYPLVKSENDRSVFPVDQEPSIQPARKNVGHPRINYGRSPETELRFGTPAWYRRNHSTEQLQTRIHKTDMHYSEIGNVTRVESSDQEINNARYPPALKSPVNSTATLQKNMWTDSSLHGSIDLEKLHDPHVLINRSKNFNDQKLRESTDPRRFPEEDRNKLPKALESLGYNENQHYEGIQEFDHRGRTGNSSADLGTIEKKDVMTKMYNVIPPVEDGLGITSPWDTLRVLDDEKKTHYTLMGFSPKQINKQLQLVGHPLMVSRTDKSNSFSQNVPHRPVDISPHFESNVNWQRATPNLQHQLLPTITQNFDQATLQDQNEEIGSRDRQTRLQSQNKKHYPRDQESPNAESPVEQQVQELAKGEKDFPDNRLKHLYSFEAPNDRSGQLPRVLFIDDPFEPIQSYRRINWILRDSEDSIPTRQEEDSEQRSRFRVQNPFDNLFEWHSRTPQRLSEVGHVSLIDPLLPEEGLEDYPSTLISQEYMDAYVNALIEDALSEMILSEQLEEDESSADRMTSKDLGSKAHDPSATMDEKFDVQQTKPTTSPSSIITEIDDQHECGNSEMNPSPTKSLAIEEGYGYPVDNEQQDYFEGFSRHQDEYLGDLEIDLTNYAFQYYYDEDKVMVTNNDEVEKLSQLQS